MTNVAPLMSIASPEPAPPVPAWQAYHRATRTATYGFLAALPLLILYEVLILLTNQGTTMQVRIGAEVWMKRLVPMLGFSGMHALAVVVLVIGIGVFWYERRKAIPLRARYFGMIVGESAAYALVLAFLVSGLVGALFAVAPMAVEVPAIALPQMVESGLGMQLALSLGAGLYEELLFRVLLVGGMYAVLKRLLPRPRYAYLTAAIVGALLFSAVHYIGALGDSFSLISFTFRFLFGLALNVVFLVRGFGVAAWTHALYDVMVVTGLLG